MTKAPTRAPSLLMLTSRCVGTWFSTDCLTGVRCTDGVVEIAKMSALYYSNMSLSRIIKRMGGSNAGTARMTTISSHTWKHPHDALNSLPAWDSEAAALANWARSTVDGLYYLADLDAAHVSSTHAQDDRSRAIDLAHIRWAASSALTAIDLCAAAISRKEDLGPRTRKDGSLHELDLLELSNRSGSSPARTWAKSTMRDPDVKLLIALRNPMVHARLPRLFKFGAGLSRTHLNADGRGDREAGELVILSLNTAARVVDDFWDQIMSGTL